MAPGRSLRRERDGRGGRFESEVRTADLARGLLLHGGKLPFCQRCGSAFEERSKVCPRCDRKTDMGYLTQIPAEFVDQANSRALRTIRERRGY